MSGFDFLEVKEPWSLSQWIGFEHPFFAITPATIISTWVVVCVVLLLIFACRLLLHNKNGSLRYIALYATRSFMDLCTQTLGTFTYHHFSFFASLFIFILLCNFMGLIPFLEEPTADLSTTLALGTFSFLYVNYYAIKAHGIKNYVLEYFQPVFVMFPLNVIGKLASIVSISFRLFGNLLGGAIIGKIYLTFLGGSTPAWYLTWVPIIGLAGSVPLSFFFGVFEGLIQAFVFTMLSLTYLSIETQSE